MKKIYLLILSILLVNIDIAFSYKIENKYFDYNYKTELKAENDTIEIVAELVECKPKYVDCGSQWFLYLFKYKIVTNNKVEYIYVIDACIELRGDNFYVVGNKYKMKVVSCYTVEDKNKRKIIPYNKKFVKDHEGEEAFISVKYDSGRVFNSLEIERLNK